MSRSNPIIIPSRSPSPASLNHDDVPGLTAQEAMEDWRAITHCDVNGFRTSCFIRDAAGVMLEWIRVDKVRRDEVKAVSS